MDQVLTLLSEGLSDTKRHPDEKLITKTMINNYSKEKLISPIQGKKYSHQHIMQILCIYQMKQTLALADVKQLTGRNDVDFETCWRAYLDIKQRGARPYPGAACQLGCQLGRSGGTAGALLSIVRNFHLYAPAVRNDHR